MMRGGRIPGGALIKTCCNFHLSASAFRMLASSEYGKGHSTSLKPNFAAFSYLKQAWRFCNKNGEKNEDHLVLHAKTSLKRAVFTSQSKEHR